MDSLRRHDPDQVPRVCGSAPHSQRRPGAPLSVFCCAGTLHGLEENGDPRRRTSAGSAVDQPRSDTPDRCAGIDAAGKETASAIDGKAYGRMQKSRRGDASKSAAASNRK
jgi:hypothetical protein